jgi:Mn-containing catalase
MILRLDRVATELPPPSDPDPDGAAAVQELLGGRFGEMSTLMNYTFQSFNFRGRQKARPFYDPSLTSRPRSTATSRSSR